MLFILWRQLNLALRQTQFSRQNILDVCLDLELHISLGEIYELGDADQPIEVHFVKEATYQFKKLEHTVTHHFNVGLQTLKQQQKQFIYLLRF